MTNTTTETEDNIDAVAELRERVQACLTDTGTSLRACASEIGFNHGILSRWLGGTSKTGDAKLEAALGEWIGRAFPKDPAIVDAYVETSGAERVYSALAFAQVNQDMVAIYGQPGNGKTRAIHQYRMQQRNAWLSTMSPAVAGVVPVLEEIAESVGIKNLPGGARRIVKAIHTRVAQRRGLIIIDEAQHLSMGAIETIRSIHDATGVGIALVGNEAGYARITNPGRGAHYAQIQSRFGLRIHLPKPSVTDVRIMAKARGVKSAEAVEILEAAAMLPGALRGVSKIIRLASVGGNEPTLDRVKSAARSLGLAGS
ncbi:MAG TPA: AAA family ATPase [Polyangiaceae bacterium]|nr:AAA family ATPase [Polyangiaceae bacterium]